LSTTYEQSGVSIAEGNKFVRHIKKAVRSTYSRAVLGDVGLFGAFFDARFPRFKSPVLVSSVDGVGTKLMIAQLADRHDTVGQDLVNHCVNDIIVCGATPLYFMDYFATGRLRNDVAAHIISGCVKACRENSCALIGGETAEMPGFYGDDMYDLAGSIVGVVERKRMITGKGIKVGDVLFGFPSSGLHTNGFSLARKVLLPRFTLNEHVNELKGTVGDALLAVHKSYLKIVTALTGKFNIRGFAHITGGGIVGNTMRVLPEGLSLNIRWDSWIRPPIFDLIQSTGEVPEEDMRKAMNLGIGLIAIVARKDRQEAEAFLRKKREPYCVIGDVVREAPQKRG
jgi:phosphoribosylformylglycinamidine cyclo-ligase